MAKWCLIPKVVDAFKQSLKDGTINPLKLAEMTSEVRHKFLEGIVGKDNALQVNSLFESKLLLQNQKAGYIAWAKKVAGLTTEARRDLVSKIERMDKILNPEEEKMFLKDLATTRLGTDVTQIEAKNIFDLSQKVKETRSAMEKGGDRMEFGRAKVSLMNYVNGLKEEASKTGLKDYLTNPIKALSDVAGNAKSIKASMDNSAIFRQGWKTLWTNPLIWQRNARQTFVDIWKTFGGKKVMDELNADIISRPNYDLMVKAKLAIGTIEEAFPGTIAEKIPLAGRVYKASENAFTGFLYRQRADIFDKYIQIAKNSGVDLTEKELQSIGSMVNSLTGRGNFGKYEGAGVNLVNNIFFSPRFVKSQFDTLGHVLTGAGGSSFVRKQAAINLVKVVAGTAGVLAVANAIKPGSVEFDSRSSDFGKIKIGNTRFDVTGGASSLIVLASRIINNASKSATTGKVSALDSGDFGASTKKDMVYNFLENKLSPVARVFADYLEGKDFKGNKLTVGGELSNLVVPISITNYQELRNDPNSANIIAAMIADGLGIGTNTYGKSTKDWSQQPTKAQEAFLNKVGETKFKSANESFNQQYDQWFTKISQTQSYKNLSDDSKQTLITNAKSTIQEKIFKQNGFIYKAPKETMQEKQEKRQQKQLLP